MNFFKSLTYRPEIRKLIDILGLGKIARKLYWFWTKPKNDILTFEIEGIVGQFYVHTPGELRLLEGLVFREKHSLKRLISFLHPGEVVYDIGAQVGLYTVPLAKTVGEQGQVIAFEPESQSFQRLQENIRFNGLHNVHFFQKALGEHSEKARLYAGEDGKWCSLINPPVNRKDISSQIVEVVRGDDFREAENLPLPRVIKIDVEGWEYAVLQGLQATLSSSTCELALVEVHPTMLPKNVKPKSVIKLLTSLGFNSINTYQRGGEYHIFAYKAKDVIIEGNYEDRI